MIKQLRQTDVTLEKGDCFRTCVAMVLWLDHSTMPNFCHEPDNWWGKFQTWLAEKHQLMAVEIPFKPQNMAPPVPGVPVILTGDSPSHPGHLHAIVGFTSDYGFEMVYDPNPADQFLTTLENILFFVPLRPDHWVASRALLTKRENQVEDSTRTPARGEGPDRGPQELDSVHGGKEG